MEGDASVMDGDGTANAYPEHAASAGRAIVTEMVIIASAY